MKMQMQHFFGGNTPQPEFPSKFPTPNETASLSFPDSLIPQAEESARPPGEKESPLLFQNLLQPIKGNGRIKTNLFD